MWAKIYWSGVYNQLIKLADPIEILIKRLSDSLCDLFEENEQLYVPPKSDTIHLSNNSNKYKNSVKQVTKCNTSGYYRIDKRARSDCRK